MIELRSPDGLARAVLLPEYGGRLHQLLVTVDGREEPLLWSPEDVADYKERPTRGGCFPMAPWPNRIRDGRFSWLGREYSVPLDGKAHAIHGRVHTRRWDVVNSREASCDLRCSFDEGWPWPGVVGIGYQLADRSLTLNIGIRSDAAFPFGLGWHPWFRREAFGGNVRVRIAAGERYELTDNLPTGRVLRPTAEFDLGDGPELGDRRLDDCYRSLLAPPEIAWVGLRLRMEVSGPQPHVQVYTPPEAFCVEPQTCAPDAFNLAESGVSGTGVEVLDGGAAVFTTSWRWTR